MYQLCNRCMEPEITGASGMQYFFLVLQQPLPGLEDRLEPGHGLSLHDHATGEDISVLDQ